MPNDPGHPVFMVPSSTSHRTPVISNRSLRLAACLSAAVLASSAPALSQENVVPDNFIAAAGASSVSIPLPDAPGYSSSAALPDAGTDSTTVSTGVPRTRHASRLDKFIEPTEIAPPLTAGDKVLLGLRASVTPFTMIGWFGSAAYGQGTDGPPNYGQNFRGFAQRLGATAARSATEDVFTDSVLAPALHEDPRYYEMGHGHNPAARALYAVSRVFITQTDSGRSTLNLAQLGGNAAGAALTQTYYPPINRGFEQTAKTFGTSLGGSALGFLFSEFLGPTARRIELKHFD